MSLTVKRVPKDFDWPLHEKWWGYLIDAPYAACGVCEGYPEYQPDKKCKWCGSKGFVQYDTIQPPAGPYFQLWETVSEGSPVSPPFETEEALAAHMVTDKRWGETYRATYEQWLAMVKAGNTFASLVISGGRLMNGVEAVSEFKK